MNYLNCKPFYEAEHTCYEGDHNDAKEEKEQCWESRSKRKRIAFIKILTTDKKWRLLRRKSLDGMV